MTVYVLKVEGNIDYYSDVVGVYRSFESAQKWQRIEEDAAIEEGEIVEGRNEGEDEDWTRSFTIHQRDLED